jgi:hypothetical protein
MNVPDANEPAPEADDMADQPSVDPTQVSPAPAPEERILANW